MSRGKGPYDSTCPSCLTVGQVTAKYAIGRMCRACIRVQNQWTCRDCGSANPRHPSPCPVTR